MDSPRTKVIKLHSVDSNDHHKNKNITINEIGACFTSTDFDTNSKAMETGQIMESKKLENETKYLTNNNTYFPELVNHFLVATVSFCNNFAY